MEVEEPPEGRFLTGAIGKGNLEQPCGGGGGEWGEVLNGPVQTSSHWGASTVPRIPRVQRQPLDFRVST